MIGGLLALKTLEGQSEALGNLKESRKTVGSDGLDKLAFSSNSRCSTVLEFVKQGDEYLVDAFTSDSCYVIKAVYWGQSSSLALEVFRAAADGNPDGFETIEVIDDNLQARDATLRALAAIPEVDAPARNLFVNWGFTSERMVRMRQLAFDTEAIPAGGGEKFGDVAKPLADNLCLKVIDADFAAWEANPTSRENPRESLRPQPENCQLLPQGHWRRFKVKPSVVAAKKPLLDALVADSKSYEAFRKEKSGLPTDVLANIEALRTLSAEWLELHRISRRIRLAMFAVRANCTDTKQPQNQILCKNREAYVAHAKSLAPEISAEIDEFKAAGYPSAAPNAFTTKIVPKYASSLTADKLKALELLKAYQALQVAMKTHQGRLGLATNHIRNVGATSVVVQFKDLAVFPPSGVAVPEEFARHKFAFTNPWLSMDFTGTAHPLVNNLRHPFNEAYAVTFGGFPVGAVQAKVEESGGASVIALPRRSRGGGPGAGGGEASNTPKNPGKETTTTDGNAPGGC
jgi:hypothetical protein